MPPDLVKLMVSEINVAVPAGPGVEAGMVVLGEIDDPNRRLRIVIGQPEARAIQGAWTGVIPVRPSTWDLFVSAIAILEGRIDRVVITSVQEERHFFAELELERDGERRTLACRPSDAVAVALRAYGAEIYAAREVVDTVGLAEDGTRYGPFEPAEPPSGPPEETPGRATEAGSARATPSPTEEGEATHGARAGGAPRTRSGRLPRKASPRTRDPGATDRGGRGRTGGSAKKTVRTAGGKGAPAKRSSAAANPAGAPAKRAGAPAKKAGTPGRRAAGPAKKAGAPAKRSGAPIRKRTPPTE